MEGYDPDALLEMYDSAEGYGSKDKINYIRRVKYAENKDSINVQKRAAYSKRIKLEDGTFVKNNGIINTKKINKKISANGEVINPMPKSDYTIIARNLVNQGVEVFAATGGDDLRYMLFIGAEGTYSNGRITHIGEIPSRGTLFEEIIHWTQAKNMEN